MDNQQSLIGLIAEHIRDANRYNWLVYDHENKDTRKRCRELLDRLGTMSKSAADMAIDAAMIETFELPKIDSQQLAKPADGWISVEDRLPEDDCRVIAATWIQFDGIQHVEIDSFNSGGGYFNSLVTHWQALPAPPKATPDNLKEE